MLYVATSHPPSAQLQALSLPFFSPSQETLVINKLNRLEFYDVEEGGREGRLKLREEVPVHGGIAVMEKVQLENSPTSSLLLLTTSLTLILLHHSPPSPTSSPTSPPASSAIQTLSSLPLLEPFSRPSEYQSILVSPCSTVAIVYAYDGLVRVIPLRGSSGEEGGAGKGRKGKGMGKKRRASAFEAEDESSLSSGRGLDKEEGVKFDLGKSYNLRLPHLNVLSLSFVPPPPTSSSASEEHEEGAAAVYPALSVLSLSPLTGLKTLTTYSLNLEGKEFDDSTAPMAEVEVEDAGSEVILPWTWAGEGGGEGERGVVVVGEESVSFYGVDGLGGSGEEEGKGKGKGKGWQGETTKGGRGGGRKVVGRLPISRITAYAPLSPSTLLLGDLYGKLLLVTFSSSSPAGSSLSSASSKPTITVKDLGDATSPTSIVPLASSSSSSSSGLVYLASRFGDSQLVRLPSFCFSGANSEAGDTMDLDAPEQEQDELELVDSLTGLAPILDAVPLSSTPSSSDSSSSGGDSAILLLSGAYKTGSLRLLRRGVGLEEVAQMEGVEGVQRVWGVSRGGRGEEGEGGEGLMVVGGWGETRVFRVSVEGGEGEAGEGGEGEEVDLEELEDVVPFTTGEGSSLLAANVGDLLVHVTPSGVYYASSSVGGGGEGSWHPSGGGEGGKKKKVTAAVARGEVVAVAVEGGEVVVLRAEAGGGGLKEVGSTTFPTDISALALSSTSSHLAVALWTPSQTVHLLALTPSSLKKVAAHTLSSSFLIRSLALTTFSSSSASSSASTVLFCGMGDGSLTSFSVSLSDGEGAIDTKTEKTVQLGRRPLLLSEVVTGGGDREGGEQEEVAVFVASERPTVVTMAKGGRLSYAGVNYSDLSAVCALPLTSSSSATPLLALSSPTSLTLARLPPSCTSSSGTNSQVSVTTVPLDEDEPRRIAHDRKRGGAGCFAVVCARRDVDRVTGEQGTVGRVRVVEEEDLSTRATLTLPPHEEGQSIASLPIPASSSSTSPLSSLTSPSQSLFLLGTTTLSPSPSSPTSEPTEGRLVLLRTTSSSPSIEQLASESLGGCPYAVVVLQGEGFGEGEYVAVAVNSQVIVLRIVVVPDQVAAGGDRVDLEVVATWAGAFVALFLAAAPDGRLVVGDAMRSMAVLRFSLPSSSTPAVAGGAIPKPKLEELGKDYRSLYMAQVEALGGGGNGGVERFIGADTDMNLFTVERDPAAGVRNLADAGTLTPAAAWHLGETVTRFRHGSFGQLLASSTPSTSSTSASASAADSPTIRPHLIYTTTAGSVGVILELDDETSRVLSELERNLRGVETGGWGGGKSVGGLEQEEFRLFKTDKQRLPSAGFIDGTFVEQFLDLSPAQQDAVVAGRNEFERLDRGREEVVRLVEEVARAH